MIRHDRTDHADDRLTASTRDMAHNFNLLRFGAPCLARLAESVVFLTFGYFENCVSNVGWFKLQIRE